MSATLRLGIDVGGTGIKGAVVDVATGELTAERFRIDTPEGAKPDDVAAVVKKVADHFDDTGSIGVTFPGVILGDTVETAANMDKKWRGVDGAKLFSDLLDRPVLVMNDADAAGVAEMRFGAGRDHQRGVVFMCTLGTGIGSALFVDGKLVPNTELGHIEINGHDAESQASGLARDEEGLSWKDYAKRLQQYLRHIDALLWTDLIIIGGGVSKESAKFLDHLKLRCPVKTAELLNNAGIVGAAVLAAERLG